MLRLVTQPESPRYDVVHVLSTPSGLGPARALAAGLEAHAGRVVLTPVAVDDPSDHGQIFRALGPFIASLPRAAAIDVLLSAGTPQAQTMWVIFVQAGLLDARMLQVIPAAFVPHPHPRAVREVRFDIEGFPEIRALRDEVARLRAETRVRTSRLVGESEPMRALWGRIARVAPTEVAVLITGETGTGKELVARAVHDASRRADGPFVAESCGALEEGVLASELFGHEAGAFTGASGRRRGLFEQAHGGTLFLDEVGELTPRMQVSLLRVLQEGVLRRVGGEAPVKVDVRVLAATHRDLRAMVAAGRFREDLYYRLQGAVLEVPPLRERGRDLELLVDHFLDELRAPRALHPTRDTWRELYRASWPGNVRQLRAEVVRWTIFCDRAIRPNDLAPEIRGLAPEAPRGVSSTLSAPRTLAEVVADAERAAVAGALEATGHNLSQAARALGIDRNTLKRKISAHGLAKAGR